MAILTDIYSIEELNDSYVKKECETILFQYIFRVGTNEQKINKRNLSRYLKWQIYLLH